MARAWWGNLLTPTLIILYSQKRIDNSPAKLIVIYSNKYDVMLRGGGISPTMLYTKGDHIWHAESLLPAVCRFVSSAWGVPKLAPIVADPLAQRDFGASVKAKV